MLRILHDYISARLCYRLSIGAYTRQVLEPGLIVMARDRDATARSENQYPFTQAIGSPVSLYRCFDSLVSGLSDLWRANVR